MFPKVLPVHVAWYFYKPPTARNYTNGVLIMTIVFLLALFGTWYITLSIFSVKVVAKLLVIFDLLQVT